MILVLVLYGFPYDNGRDFTRIYAKYFAPLEFDPNNLTFALGEVTWPKYVPRDVYTKILKLELTKGFTQM